MNPLLAILGPTAAGKSELALRLAREVGGAVVSVDSMQVYRGMDIGTSKPSPEDRSSIPHHMIDVAEPEERYTVARFQQEARAILSDAPTVIVGGSGLHFRALVDPLHFAPHDPELRSRLEEIDHEEAVRRLVALDREAGSHVDLRNPRRVVRALETSLLSGVGPSARAARVEAADIRAYRADRRFVAVGVDPGPDLGRRAERRLDGMLSVGLLDEVDALRERLGPTARQAVGYRQLLPVTMGEASLEEGRAQALRATLALARRQRTFFRRDPRIRWLRWDEDPEARYRRVRETLLDKAGRCAS